jgi:thioester reductase-like protein
VDVFSLAEDNGIRTIVEGDDIGPTTSLYNGYAQSKCAAEKLVKIAHSRGLPISIYRPSNIVGHSQTGICSTSNFISLMIKGCLEMSIAPEIEAILNLVPVDYVSRAIVCLSRQEKPCGQNFNLINSEPIEWKNLIHWMQRIGYSIEQVPYQTWYAELLNLGKQGSENILVSLAPLFLNQNLLKSLLGGFNFDAENTINQLASYEIVCPPINEELLNTYFSYFTRSGFLPALSSAKQSKEFSPLSNSLEPHLIRI